MRAVAAALAVVALVPMAAKGCDSGSGGKATEAAYAGNGVTQFTTNGKLKFGQGYKAHYVDTTDRQNCKWSLHTQNDAGEDHLIKSGNYFSANIKVEKPTRVKVFLHSQDCGNWKPTK